MKVIAPFAVVEHVSHGDPEKFIETVGRVCYKSENKRTPTSARDFVSSLISRGHHSVLEHVNITVRFVIDRGVSHELVRHRIVAFSQESTRFCNYAKGSFGNELTFIRPCFWKDSAIMYALWQDAMERAESTYIALINKGAKPEEARSVLPNSLKTEVVVTANLREWRHIFKLRTSNKAHPQMREVMMPLWMQLCDRYPAIFGSLA